eukprot:TRINITY_DN121665_c0_g1_i1.p1 TRINITY_DN121665_c0_g1~~TRINITY_DN121665_c0_g1_i1.p1  ORF type:complete len:609 (-),score=119.89 TRINITY_DN121665_c0_g1_i1:295-2046(-)
MDSCDLIEEPVSGTLVPATVEDGDETQVLVSVGLRSKRIAFLDVKVYVFAVYVSREDAHALATSIDNEGSDVVGSPALLGSLAEKTCCLIFLRDVTAAQVAGGLKEGFLSVGIPEESFAGILQSFSAPMAKGAQVRIKVQPSTGNVLVSPVLHPESTRMTQEPQALKYDLVGGADLCTGFQQLYFGPKSVTPGVSKSLAQLAPMLLQRYPLKSSDGAEPAHEDGDSSPDLAPMTPPSRGVSSEEVTPATPTADHCDEDMSQLPSLPSQDGGKLQGSSSWKNRAGRASGKDKYQFGDLTRSFLQRSRRRSRGVTSESFSQQSAAGEAGEILSFEQKDDAEGSQSSWFSAELVPELNDEAVQVQHLQSTFYKHHTSALRSLFASRWSSRHLELRGKVVCYRRKAEGEVAGMSSLDGARVVVENSRPSELGDFYAFRIIWDGIETWRLATSSRSLAVAWVSTLVGTLRSMQSPLLPLPDEHEQASDEQAADVKADAEANSSLSTTDTEEASAQPKEVSSTGDKATAEVKVSEPATSALKQVVAVKRPLYPELFASRRKYVMLFALALLFGLRRLRQRFVTTPLRVR